MMHRSKPAANWILCDRWSAGNYRRIWGSGAQIPRRGRSAPVRPRERAGGVRLAKVCHLQGVPLAKRAVYRVNATRHWGNTGRSTGDEGSAILWSPADVIPSTLRKWRNWQTRKPQELVPEREWRFEPSLPHQSSFRIIL